MCTYIERNPIRAILLKEPYNPNEIKGIREKTRTGQPLGTDDFIERLEGQLKRLFKLKPKERPKKKVDK